MDLLFPLLIVFMIGMIFFSNRQRKKQQQQQQSLQDSIAVGDVVVMTCGVSGTVVDTDDEKTIDLEIAPEVITTWLRAAVREKLSTDVDSLPGDDHLGTHDLDAEHAELTGSARPTNGATPHGTSSNGTPSNGTPSNGTPSNGIPAAASEPHDATGFSDPTATPTSRDQRP
jgi:preprotein translocase subunit YajC